MNSPTTFATLAANATKINAAVPRWATYADSTAEIDDTWQELCDPGNERGEIATAYFEHAAASGDYSDGSCFDYAAPKLSGISIEGEGGAFQYLDAEQAADAIGEARVARIEAAQERDLQ